MKEPAGCLSQQAIEAEGSLTLGIQGRVGSSPNNGGAHRDYLAVGVAYSGPA